MIREKEGTMRHAVITSSAIICLVITVTAGSALAKVIRTYQGKLNINSASAADFTRLPGVGEIIGFRIVKEREPRGKFTAIKELQQVKGVSPRLYDGFKNYVTLEGESNLRVHIDLNTITRSLLLGLPGMTAGEANSIINYRKARRAFTAVEDLTQVPGIDERRMRELAEWLTVVRQRR